MLWCRIHEVRVKKEAFKIITPFSEIKHRNLRGLSSSKPRSNIQT